MRPRRPVREDHDPESGRSATGKIKYIYETENLGQCLARLYIMH